MPADWRTITLGDFVTLQRGHDLPESKRSPGDIPILGSFGITGWHNKAKADGPGVTVGRSGASFGVVSYSERDYWPLNTALYVNDFHGNDPKFAYYFLQSMDFRHYNSGSAQPSLNRNHIHPIPVSIPGLDEQKAIAHILGTLDDKIELNRQMNATLEAMAQALFKSWFVDFDPVIDNATAAGNPIPEPLQARAEARAALGDQRKPLPEAIQQQFPSSFVFNEELGWVPEGWEVGAVGDLCSSAIGGLWGNDVEEEGATPAICIRGVDMGSLRSDGFAPDAPVRFVKVNALEKRRASEADLFVAGSGAGPCGRPLWYAADLANLYEVPVIYSNFVKRVTAQSSAHAIYLDRFLYRKYTDGTIEDFITGTSVPNLDLNGLLSGCKILIAPECILSLFEKQQRSIFRKLYSQDSRTLASLRDTLLPKLLAGQLRIPDAEKQVADVV